MALVNLRSNLKNLKFTDFSAKPPYVVKDINNPPSLNSLSLQINKRLDDVERFTKLFKDKPGAKYLLNEVALKQLESRGKSDLLTRVLNSALYPIKLVGSTLAQVAVNGTGTHFIKAFNSYKYLDQEGNNVPLFGDKIRTKIDQIYSTVKTNIDTNTLIRTTVNKGEFFPQSIQEVKQNQDIYSTEGKNVSAQNIQGVSQPGNQLSQDFRRIKNNTYYFDYTSGNVRKETKFNLGDQGKRSSKIDYTSPVEFNVRDSINYLDPFDETTTTLDKQQLDDLINFKFKIITPDRPSGVSLVFRAFLDSFDDGFNADWNSFKYVGRGETFYTYGGFSRNLNLSFKVAAATRDEMSPLYKKMVYLASSTAPTYNNNFMRGTLVKLTVGDYLSDVPGILNSVGYSWDNSYPWEISLSNELLGIEDNLQRLPHILNCTVAFTPIHNFTPQTGYYPFMTLSEDVENRKKFFETAQIVKQ